MNITDAVLVLKYVVVYFFVHIAMSVLFELVFRKRR